MLVTDPRIIVPWAHERLNGGVRPDAVLGWAEDGQMTAAALMHSYYPGGNIDLGLAIDGRLRRGFLRALCDFIFNQLDCARITCRPPESLRGAISQLHRAGFRTETLCKRYYGDENAVQMVLTRDKCKWI